MLCPKHAALHCEPFFLLPPFLSQKKVKVTSTQTSPVVASMQTKLGHSEPRPKANESGTKESRRGQK